MNLKKFMNHLNPKNHKTLLQRLEEGLARKGRSASKAMKPVKSGLKYKPWIKSASTKAVKSGLTKARGSKKWIKKTTGSTKCDQLKQRDLQSGLTKQRDIKSGLKKQTGSTKCDQLKE